MARVFIDGFESGNVNAWDEVSGSFGSYIAAGYAFTGNFGAYFISSSYWVRKYFTARADMFVAMRVKPLGAQKALIFFCEGNVTQGGIAVDATPYTIRCWKGHIPFGAGAVATTTETYNYGEWILLEMYYKCDDSVGRWILKVNGIPTSVDFTGDTRYGGATGLIDNIRIGTDAYSSWPPNAHIDNIVFDTANWIGDTRIAGIKPSGAGNSTQWTPSAGSNWDCVDEAPESDADYVSITSMDQVDTYAADDLPAEAYAVKSVQVSARARKQSSVAPQNIALAVRTGGADYFGSDSPLGFSYDGHTALWENNPGTASPWTPSEVNGAEIGIKSRA